MGCREILPRRPGEDWSFRERFAGCIVPEVLEEPGDDDAVLNYLRRHG